GQDLPKQPVPQMPAVALPQKVAELEAGRSVKTVSLAARLGLRPQTLEPSWEVPRPAGGGAETAGASTPAARLPAGSETSLAPGVVPLPDLSSGSLDAVFSGYPAPPPADAVESTSVAEAPTQREVVPLGTEARRYADGVETETTRPQGVAHQAERYDGQPGAPRP